MSRSVVLLYFRNLSSKRYLIDSKPIYIVWIVNAGQSKVRLQPNPRYSGCAKKRKEFSWVVFFRVVRRKRVAWKNALSRNEFQLAETMSPKIKIGFCDVSCIKKKLPYLTYTSQFYIFRLVFISGHHSFYPSAHHCP